MHFLDSLYGTRLISFCLEHRRHISSRSAINQIMNACLEEIVAVSPHQFCPAADARNRVVPAAADEDRACKIGIDHVIARTAIERRASTAVDEVIIASAA